MSRDINVSDHFVRLPHLCLRNPMANPPWTLERLLTHAATCDELGYALVVQWTKEGDVERITVLAVPHTITVDEDDETTATGPTL